MSEEMNEFYKKPLDLMKATNIEPGLYYSILVEGDWYRIQCLDYDPKTDEATVFFIDYGDKKTYDAKLIHFLDKKFCKLPSQVFNNNF